MSFSKGWKTFNFLDGKFMVEDIVFFNDNVDITHINDNQGSVSISWYALPDKVRKNWKYYFQKWATGMFYYDPDNADRKSYFGGIITNSSLDLEDESIEIKLEDVNAWLKRNSIYPNDIKQYDLKSKSTKYNDLPWNIAQDLLENLLKDPYAPSNWDLPPKIPADQVVEGNKVTREYVWSQKKDVGTAIEELINEYYGGWEIRYNFLMNAAGDGVIVRVQHGDSAFPAIMTSYAPIDIDLEDPDVDVVDYKVVEDASSQYNSIWVSSTYKRGDGDYDAIRYRPGDYENNPVDPRMPRLEYSLDFDYPVADFNKSDQALRRLEDEEEVLRVISLNAWDDKHVFASNIGRRIQVAGRNDMTGLEGMVRLIGVSHSTSDSQVKLSVTPIRQKYPRVPRDIEAIQSGVINTQKIRNTTPAQGDAGENDLYRISDFWGNEGQVGTNDLPTMYRGYTTNLVNQAPYSTSNYPGTPLINTGSIVQDSRNGVYGLNTLFFDKILNGEGHPDDTFEVYDGEIYVRHTTVQNGNVLPWNTPKTITFDELYAAIGEVPTFYRNTRYSNNPQRFPTTQEASSINYERYLFDIFVAADRLYLKVQQRVSYGYYDTYPEYPVYNPGTGNTEDTYVQNRYSYLRSYVLAAPIADNGDIGTFTLAHEMSDALHADTTARMGDVVVFSNLTRAFGQAPPTGQMVTKNYEFSAEGSGFYYLPPIPSKLYTAVNYTFLTYNTYLYAIPGLQDGTKLQNKRMIYRIKLSPTGRIEQDNSWIETALMPEVEIVGNPTVSVGPPAIFGRGNLVILDVVPNWDPNNSQQRTVMFGVNTDGSFADYFIPDEWNDSFDVSYNGYLYGFNNTTYNSEQVRRLDA